MDVFEPQELLEAMQSYLTKKVGRGTFTEVEAQEWPGMCLRKKSLKSVLRQLIRNQFLIQHETVYQLTDQDVKEYKECKESLELYHAFTIQDRLLTYLQKKCKPNVWWSEVEMQEWEGMSLRKRAITIALEDLVEDEYLQTDGYMYCLED